MTALHYAVQDDNIHIAKSLIEHGSDYFIKDRKGKLLFCHHALCTFVFGTKGKFNN